MNLFDDDFLMSEPEVIGCKGVTEDQAAENRARGRGPRRPRPEVRGVPPMAHSTWHAGIAKGIFPKPTKIGTRSNKWWASEIRAIAKREPR